MTDEQFMKERLMGDRIERKALGFQLESIEEDGTFSGHAAAFGNIDNGGDVILPGAFARTIKEDFDRIKILSLHNDFELPIGKPIELREDEKGLFLKAKISDTQKGRDVLTLMRDGVLNRLSIGYNAVEFDFDSATGVRTLKEVKLWEISVVTWAMNDLAQVDEVKSRCQSDKAKEVMDGLKSVADDLKDWTEEIIGEAKAGRMSRSKINSLKPFIAVVKEMADILGPLLDPPAQEEQPPETEDIKQQKNTKQNKGKGMVIEIIPTNTRRYPK